MIVVFGGRRTSGRDGAFPDTNVPYVKQRIERLIAGIRPSHLIGSAAAGSDILFLEAALKHRIPATVVVTGGRKAFAAASVDDRPGWRHRFDRVLRSRRVSVREARAGTGDEAYRAVNTRIVDTALRMRDSQAHTEILGLVVSDGGGRNHTEELAAELDTHGVVVLRVDPLVTKDEAPLAFVAMPFGDKPDPARRTEPYQSDATWDRLLFPALTDAGYRAVRADSEARPAVIDTQMIRNLLRADLVVADLATLNPNVLWELGVRHVAQRQGTMVIQPRSAAIPFDLTRLSIRPYERAAEAITDQQMLDGLRMLKEALTEIGEHRGNQDHVDSPVHDMVRTLRLVGLPETTDPNLDLAEMVDVARETDDMTGLVDAAQAAQDANIAPEDRTTLQLKAALSLVEGARYDAAIDILRPLADADAGHDNELLQQTYAHALVRTGRRPAASLEDAEARLRTLNERHPGSAETLGLIGSVAKAHANRRNRARKDATAELRTAAEAYEEGFHLVPTDYYPGVNAVTLRRLLADHADLPDRERDRNRAAAIRLLPVVRFMAERAPGTDGWARATLAELALQEHLLADAPYRDAKDRYAVAAAQATKQQCTSMANQLKMLREWGDSDEVITPLLEAVTRRRHT
ncbi:TRAFs-binding domain-containing protein [Cryptosporangium japonicum]|uniref:Tetratricopeptide repeat protein n=1 Tax=Cryptosporangium japonicum TaxID=80872 RepID=A0ABN0UFL4_9ACTN